MLAGEQYDNRNAVSTSSRLRMSVKLRPSHYRPYTIALGAYDERLQRLGPDT
ncbi:hypothetical protein BCR43DRAFT_519380 [Syncephalastrum racemosum]|uniref:Uncharacterized protein n=1 Tax=Syncephalastrum racemosum TaxID=13706 RepID=A0A1X2GZ34_SYNRA|nr:hypothetical protein BCR43DRAFT_519380 [Syncephalastrum racemosum]